MKPRRVIVTIEVTTADPVKDIKNDILQNFTAGTQDVVHQVQVNVVKKEKK